MDFWAWRNEGGKIEHALLWSLGMSCSLPVTVSVACTCHRGHRVGSVGGSQALGAERTEGP